MIIQQRVILLSSLAVASILMATEPMSSFARGAESPSSVVAFEPNESLVSPQEDLLDPEYDQKASRVVWVDTFGNLWLASLDSEGMFQPSDGKGTLIDNDAMKLIDLRITGNGPEWIQTDEGPKVVYTKFVSGLPHLPRYARVAVAEPVLPGGTQWTFAFLSPSAIRMSPYASKDMGDPNPRFTCGDEDRNHYWVELYDPGSEILLPLIEPHPYGVRSVLNSRAVVFTAPSPLDSTEQAFRYDVDTQVAEQLTFDVVGVKDQSSVWMWPAPEFDGEYVFFVLVVVGNSTKLDIYRQQGAVWTKIHTIAAPLSTIGSPEPFTFNGHSYIVFQLTVGSDEWPSSIWLAGIDSENELLRRITDNSLFRWRTDPEVFITSKGPYVYYNRRDPADPNACALQCTEGVFRAHTGLVYHPPHAAKGPQFIVE